MSEKEYYLGLDLGIASVGWAVMAKENDEYYIDDFGVRLFSPSEYPKTGKTCAEQRREFRSGRRLNRRRKQRINELKFFLEKIDVVSREEIDNFFSNFKITNNIFYDEKKYFNPYVIRNKSLSEKVTGQELAVALINIANHRGYNNEFSFGEEKENGKLKEPISKSRNVINNYKTIAQAIINEQDFRNSENEKTLGLIHNKNKKNNPQNSEYRYLFSRESYEQELESILAKQAEFYPKLAEKDNRDRIIKDIILRQRDFEVGPGPKDEDRYREWTEKTPNHRLFKSFLDSEGKCNFYPEEGRGFSCSLTFEIFRFFSDFSTVLAKGFEKETIAEFANQFFSDLKQGIIWDKSFLKKIITSKDKEILKNNKAWGNFKINFKYLELMKKLMPSKFQTIEFDNLENHIFNGLGKILHENITPSRRKDKLLCFFKINNIKIDGKTIEDELLHTSIAINTSTSNASFKYMKEALMNWFLCGIPYGKFQADFLKKNEKEIFAVKFKTNSKKPFGPINDPDLQKNAVVFRAVNQARKVVKSLYQEYHNFKVVNVEVARELAKSFEDRKKIKKNNDARFENKMNIEKELEKEKVKVNGINVKKYRLWEQQNGKCVYCKDNHPIKVCLFDKGSYQIDHIIPQSKFVDDSLNNLVLVCIESNQNKSDKIPLKWMEKLGKENEKAYKKFVEDLYKKEKISDKKFSYLMTESLDDDTLQGFSSRNLNDTRYITSYFTNWLNSEFKKLNEITSQSNSTKVQAINGIVTSNFRRIWLNGSAWGLEEKVRDITPFHHAVDAMILTQFLSSNYIDFASDSINIVNLKKRLKNSNSFTEEDYRHSCDEILKKWEGEKMRSDLGNRLRKLVDKKMIGDFKIMPPMIENIKDVIEKRFPVILETKKEERKTKDGTRSKPVEVPKFVKVLNQEEYYEKLNREEMKGNIHYPFISYKTNYKLSGPLTGSENPLSKKKRKDKDINSYYSDKNGNFWDIDTYYGVIFDPKHNFNPIWIRRIEAKEKLNQYKKENLLVPKTLVEYYDEKNCRKNIKVFNSKMSNSVYSNLLGTTYTSDKEKYPKIFGEKNYDSIRNWKKDFKILKPDILGRL